MDDHRSSGGSVAKPTMPDTPDFDAVSAAVNPCTRPGCRCRYASPTMPDTPAVTPTTRIGMEKHKPEPKLMPVGQEWYCVRCNKTIHKRRGVWAHNPEPHDA